MFGDYSLLLFSDPPPSSSASTSQKPRPKSQQHTTVGSNRAAAGGGGGGSGTGTSGDARKVPKWFKIGECACYSFSRTCKLNTLSLKCCYEIMKIVSGYDVI